MHYSDGIEARVGDVVVGKGYNIKDSAGHPKTLIGIMHGIVPGSETCNCQILLLEPIDASSMMEVWTAGIWTSVVLVAGRLYKQRVEYGQCNHFALATPRLPD